MPRVSGAFGIHVGLYLPARLLLAQLPLHLVNIPLQLVDALPLAFLHEAPYKEKQEKNHKSDYHLAHSFLFNEGI